MFVIVICTIVEGLGNCSGINRAIKLSYRSINSSAYILGKVVRSAAIVFHTSRAALSASILE